MKLIAARRAARLVGPLSREGLPARDRGELEVERGLSFCGRMLVVGEMVIFE